MHVIIYEHANYQGKSQELSEGKYNLADINIGNDKLSSIRITEGLKVTLFEHSNFRGRRKTFTKDIEYVGNDFNDLTSSLKVEKKKVCIIYEHANYQGASQELSEGEYNLADINIGNDKLSSIRIPYGIKVTLFEHANFQGKSKTFTCNTKYVGDDFNDLTSSLKIEQQKMSEGHGSIGDCATNTEERELESPFSRLFDRFDLTYKPHAISLLAGGLGPMQEGPRNISFKPSLEAGFTFLGQFIDHDLTEFRVIDENGKFVEENPVIGVSQIVEPDKNPTSTNGRTGLLDLDSVYGVFGENAPELFDSNGFFILGDAQRTNGQGARDIQRNTNFGEDGRKIADPRNDENKIIVQLHTLFMRLHNAIHANNPGDIESENFATTKKTVQQIYRQIVFCDYLPRIVTTQIINKVIEKIKAGQSFYQRMNVRVNEARKSEGVVAMPVEFAQAVFRLGHSQLLDFYGLNINNVFPLFVTSLTGQQTDLRGREAITEETEIDWSFFFGEKAQLGRPLDTQLPPSVFRLPRPAVNEPPISLAERNILRGIDFGLPSGQKAAEILSEVYGKIEKVPEESLGITQDILEIEDNLRQNTPLWYYILREAEVVKPRDLQLGEVGGYIVAETILGSLAKCNFNLNITCPASPEQSADIKDPKQIFSMVNLLNFLKEIE